VVEKITDHENLGGVFRNAAAFGIDVVLLDAESADPLYRRCVRVSIGHVLTVPWARIATLAQLHESGFPLVALTPAAGAVSLREFAWPERCALLFGSEGPGLSPAWLARPTRMVRIPMQPGVDSVTSPPRQPSRSTRVRDQSSSCRRRARCDGERDRVEQCAVVGDEEHGAGKRVEGLFELFDCREIEVVGGLVEHEALTPRADRSASDARVRSPGESESDGRVTWSLPRPNLARSERASFCNSPLAASKRGGARRHP